MKLAIALPFVLVGSLAAVEPTPPKKPRSSVPAPYPPIIKMTPAGDATGKPAGIIQSELGGREMQFFQAASQAGSDLLLLTELAKTRSTSEQVKAVAETLAQTQVTENTEVGRLAAAKKMALTPDSANASARELGALSGPKFDKAWIERLIGVNESSAVAYAAGAKSADADVRSFAEKMLPVARARLQMAQRLGGRPVAPSPAPASAAPRPLAADRDVARPIPPPVATPAPAKAARP